MQETHSLRPTRAEIDLRAVTDNLTTIRSRLHPGTQLMAVVKANAYGHGAVEVSRTALNAGATQLAVSSVDEGIVLRRAGISAPILVLGWVPPSLAGEAVHHRLDLACFDSELAWALSAAGGGRVHIKVDTGIGRLGVRPEEVIELARSLPANVELAGLFTHFHSAADADPTPTVVQLERFQDVLLALTVAGIRPGMVHAANSSGVLLHPKSHFDMVRVGSAMYGLYPDRAREWAVTLKPAMTLKTRIGLLKEMRSGETVSYGRTWTARGGELVATLPIGYADGFRRLFSNKGAVLIGGRRCPVAGRICMDMTMVQVPNDLGARVGDEVVLLGAQGDDVITADEWADSLGTINREVTCLIGARVPRIYEGN